MSSLGSSDSVSAAPLTPPASGSVRFLVTAFVSGVLFATGLVLSGMTLPSKVVGFFDFSNGLASWDPSLALVMAGAMAVYVPVWSLAKDQKRPLFDVRFHVPTRRVIDLKLLGGSLIFGVGWGVSGFCPGPALVSLGALSKPAIVMAVGMLLGIVAFQGWERLRPSVQVNPRRLE